MLRLRGCDRPRPSRSFGEGVGEWGLTELRAGPPGSNSPSTPTPAFKTHNFPLMEKDCRGVRGGAYGGNTAGNKVGGALGSPVLQGTSPDLRSVDVLLILWVIKSYHFFLSLTFLQ